LSIYESINKHKEKLGYMGMKGMSGKAIRKKLAPYLVEFLKTFSVKILKPFFIVLLSNGF